MLSLPANFNLKRGRERNGRRNEGMEEEMII
jgi:hypothetical protein